MASRSGAESHPIFCCPSCRAPLVSHKHDGVATLCCDTREGEEFPLLGGSIPVLMEHGKRYLARACIDARQMLDSHDAWLSSLATALEHATDSRPRLERIHAAEKVNRALLEQVLRMLERGVSVQPLLDAANLPPSASIYVKDWNLVLGYLRRDFGGRAESEEELRVVTSAVQQELAAHLRSTGTAVLLGAGVGRIACELRRTLQRVVALDSSPIMACVYELLRRRKLEFHEINLVNAPDVESAAVPVTAALPDSAARALPEYVVADGAALPFPDASLSAIVSVYFSDVIPFHSYAKEVLRTLQPGGVFVHFGPLGYHFQDIEQQPSVPEFLSRLSAQGLSVQTPRFLTNTFHASSASLFEQRFRNLCVTAVKPG